jgi:hypothetical protein
LATLCIAQFSLITAAAFHENPVSKENYQQEKVPKSVIIKTKKFKAKNRQATQRKISLSILGSDWKSNFKTQYDYFGRRIDS